MHTLHLPLAVIYEKKKNSPKTHWSIQLWLVSYYYTHSLYHFINSAIVALKSNIVTFYRCQINTGDIWLQFKKNEKKPARWHCNTKISKTNLKTMISPLLTSLQGCQGCQKIRTTKLKTTLVSWSAKLNNIKKTFRKQGFFDNFCSILMVFHSFCNFDES